jgi:adenine phosphoribosyltransferase
MAVQSSDLVKFIRAIPDWPKPGILFRDITPLLADHDAYLAAVEALVADYRDIKIDYVAAVEARGFIFGSAVAERLQAGFIPVRKQGKLPYRTESYTYDLEYGTDTLEVHVDAIKKGTNVLLVDDLLATGGTMNAACSLIEKVGGTISGISFLIELPGLSGREKLGNHKISTVITY